MNVGIHYNLDKDRDFKKTGAVAEILVEAGVNVFFADQTYDYKVIGKDIDISALDCMIVLGGDGTVLSASKATAPFDIPILSINIGNLGFLTSYEYDDLDDAIECLLNWNFKAEKRTMLETTLNGEKYLALNDIVISRQNVNSPFGHIASFKAYACDSLIDVFLADGLIVSTPTGSTAYSLSAGGPIVDPTVRTTLITSICSHSLHNRPICVNSESQISIEILKTVRDCQVSVDGDLVGVLAEGETLDIFPSAHCVTLLKPKNENFYHRLYTKLTKWSEK